MTYANQPVESSNVSSVAYDDKTRILSVTFKNGETYNYESVPPSVGNSFPYLASKGKGIWELLRGQYSFTKS